MNIRRFILLPALMIIISQLSAQLTLTSDSDLHLNYDGLPIGASSFILSGDANFQGMYCNTESSQGKPFYGYSNASQIEAFTYYDGVESLWKLWVENADILHADVDQISVLGKFKIEDDITIENTERTLLFGDISTGQMVINGNTPLNMFSDLTLHTETPDFGGMYINSAAVGNNRPYYGYAVAGLPVAYHVFDDSDNCWRLYAHLNEQIEIYENKTIISNPIVINGTDHLNQYTDLTIHSDKAGFGGIYINTTAGDNAQPFYGYATDGVDKAFHSYDPATESWRLYLSTGELINVSNTEISLLDDVSVSNTITVGPRDVAISALAPGAIYYQSGHFYGKMSDGTVRQLDNEPTTNLSSTDPSNESLQSTIDLLMAENRKLAAEIEALKIQVQAIDKYRAER